MMTVVKGRAASWESEAVEAGIRSPADSGCATRVNGFPSGKSPIPRVSLVDDDEDLHLFVKDVGDSGHFQFVLPCRTAAEALEQLPQDRPDAVIMDIRLPDMSGIDCTAKLHAILPALPILMLTGYPDGRVFFRSLMAGARGFLVKPVSVADLLRAVDDVVKGKFALGEQAFPFLLQLVQQLKQLTQDNQSLTKREQEVLACIFEGMQDKEIASALGIGTATVHTHMHRLFEKLGVHSRQDIIAKFLALQQ